MKNDNKDLLLEIMRASVRLAFMRHDLRIDPDADMTEEYVANESAHACFGENTEDADPIPELAELLRRLASAVPAGPRCPKCQGINLALYSTEDGYKVGYCNNPLCKHKAALMEFFAPSPATGQPPQAEELWRKHAQDSWSGDALAVGHDDFIEAIKEARAVPAPESPLPPQGDKRFREVLIAGATEAVLNMGDPEDGIHLPPNAVKIIVDAVESEVDKLFTYAAEPVAPPQCAYCRDIKEIAVNADSVMACPHCCECKFGCTAEQYCVSCRVHTPKPKVTNPAEPVALEEVARLRKAKDDAYSERDNLVAALSKLFPAGLERHPDSDATWENDWRWIVFIDLPTGQATWHIHDSELSMFDHLPRFTGREWDGHTTPEKYRRLSMLSRLGAGEPKGAKQ